MKFYCRCGNTLSNVTCPNNVEGSLVSDFLRSDLDEITDTYEPVGEDEIMNWLSRAIYMLECDGCGSLWFEVGNRKMKRFMPEDGKYHGLLNRKGI